MPQTISLHTIEGLATAEIKNAILLHTNLNTELHIVAEEDRTTITFPFGNKFDIVGGNIIIYEKR